MKYWKGGGEGVGNTTLTGFFANIFHGEVLPKLCWIWKLVMYLSLHGNEICALIQITGEWVCTSGRMLAARKWRSYLYTISFSACGPVSCIMSAIKDLLFRENSCNTKLCWLEEINKLTIWNSKDAQKVHYEMWGYWWFSGCWSPKKVWNDFLLSWSLCIVKISFSLQVLKADYM